MDMLDIARDFFRLILGWRPPHIRLLVEAFAAVFRNFFLPAGAFVIVQPLIFAEHFVPETPLNSPFPPLV